MVKHLPKENKGKKPAEEDWTSSNTDEEERREIKVVISESPKSSATPEQTPGQEEVEGLLKEYEDVEIELRKQVLVKQKRMEVHRRKPVRPTHPAGTLSEEKVRRLRVELEAQAPEKQVQRKIATLEEPATKKPYDVTPVAPHGRKEESIKETSKKKREFISASSLDTLLQ